MKKTLIYCVVLLLVCACNDPEVFTVTLSGEKVTVSPNTSQSITTGSTVSFTVTADSNYTLSTTVGGTCAAGSWAGSVYTTGIVTADCTVSFSAALNTYTVTTSGSNLSVSPSSPTVSYGSTQAFSVTASTNYTLNTTVGGTCPSGSWSGSTYTTGAITENCTASFSAALNTYTVTTSGSNLSVSPSSPTVSYGSTQALVVTPSTNYTVSSTVGGTCPSGSWSGSTYTTGAITENCTVSFSAVDRLLYGLQALYHLDGTVGSIANGDAITDSSGNGNGGTASTSAANLQYATGKFSEGVTFANSNKFITFGTSFGNFGTSDFSIALWFKSSYNSATQQLINKRSICGHESMFNVAINSNGRMTFEVDEDGSGTDYIGLTTPAGTAYNDGSWHHVVAVRETTSATLYIDGSSKITGTASGVANISNSVPFKIGNLPCTSQPFIGTVDEVIVYNRALNTDDITRLSSATSPLGTR